MARRTWPGDASILNAMREAGRYDLLGPAIAQHGRDAAAFKASAMARSGLASAAWMSMSHAGRSWSITQEQTLGNAVIEHESFRYLSVETHHSRINQRECLVI
jgi:hypothetical protein